VGVLDTEALSAHPVRFLHPFGGVVQAVPIIEPACTPVIAR
jgi:hypothetical protein